MAKLSEGEQSVLLAAARDALEAAVAGRDPRPVAGEDDSFATEPGACFVTLYHRGDLRGCIGTLDAAAPLTEVVRSMSASAALRDPRFAPVTAEELPDIAVSLSVLTPARPIEDVSEIEVGRHGLIVQRGPARGVLLPQVATDRQWDALTFLRATCQKAGLPPEAHGDPDTRIEVFSAVVFSETSKID